MSADTHNCLKKRNEVGRSFGKEKEKNQEKVDKKVGGRLRIEDFIKKILFKTTNAKRTHLIYEVKYKVTTTAYSQLDS